MERQLFKTAIPTVAIMKDADGEWLLFSANFNWTESMIPRPASEAYRLCTAARFLEQKDAARPDGYVEVNWDGLYTVFSDNKPSQTCFQERRVKNAKGEIVSVMVKVDRTIDPLTGEAKADIAPTKDDVMWGYKDGMASSAALAVAMIRNPSKAYRVPLTATTERQLRHHEELFGKDPEERRALTDAYLARQAARRGEYRARQHEEETPW